MINNNSSARIVLKHNHFMEFLLRKHIVASLLSQSRPGGWAQCRHHCTHPSARRRKPVGGECPPAWARLRFSSSCAAPWAQPRIKPPPRTTQQAVRQRRCVRRRVVCCLGQPRCALLAQAPRRPRRQRLATQTAVRPARVVPQRLTHARPAKQPAQRFPGDLALVATPRAPVRPHDRRAAARAGEKAITRRVYVATLLTN